MRRTRTSGQTGAAAGSAMPDLVEYHRRRDFDSTSEPAGRKPQKAAKSQGVRHFVVQKHDARHLHYDFRLELEGVLKSWAVPKGPSLDPKLRRLAVQVEDHPLDYADFEGHIPAGNYGAGEVIVWDRGEWQSLDTDAGAAYRAGKLRFKLFGKKLSGGWTLVRTRLAGKGGQAQWLLIKERDAAARAEADYDVTLEQAHSVLNPPPAAPPPTGAPRAPQSRDPAPAGQRKPLFAELSPALATLVRQAPAGDWRYEIKFDGYRLLARVENAEARLFTRNGLDWTGKLEALAAAVAGLGVKTAWLDGEIVVTGQDGKPDFQALQNAFERGSSHEVVYFLFDLPYFNGQDLRAEPLEQRRDVLRSLLSESASDRLRYSEDLAAPAADILHQACAMGLEGIIGKRSGSPYRAGRSGDWIKLKCKQRQEFVIGGLTRPRGGRQALGALLLGVNDAAGLRYVGRVGTGFSAATLKNLLGQLSPLARHSPPFTNPPPGRQAVDVVWLEPRRVCEVEYAAWTGEGRIRHATFCGLRDDKDARSVQREIAASGALPPRVKEAAGNGAASPAEAKIAGTLISHPDRLIDPESGTSKRALAEFYRDIAPWLLPQLSGRPLSIVRAPGGVAGEQFFQRHAGTLAVPGMRLHEVQGEQLMEIRTLRALIGAVQMGSIEFHTWNARTSDIDFPDRLVFDLDPDPSLPWSRIIEATRILLALLDEIGLQSFLKTSGGKGMHVVVPLARRHDWATVKEFSKRVAAHLARVFPLRFADRMGPRNRVGKIYVDYLRNHSGGTTVAAYSVRARPGLGVSVPIARDELESVGGAAAWTVRNLRERLESLARDPWAAYTHRQSITREMTARLVSGGAR